MAALLADTAIPGLSEIFWDLRTVAQKTGLSRATIYRYMARGVFPQRRKVGPGRVAWLASEIIAWSFSRPIVRDNSSKPV